MANIEDENYDENELLRSDSKLLLNSSLEPMSILEDDQSD